jgi:hypothetical protein
MKAGILTLAAAVGVLLLAQTAPQAASAEKAIQNASPGMTDLSAQRRYRRPHVRVYQPYRSAYRGYSAYGYPVNDPSLGYFPNLRRAQAEGRCVTDEGYGRFSFCDW